MMGLMLHANAKQLIRREKYKDALEVLAMGEVSNQCTWCQKKKAFRVPEVTVWMVLVTVGIR